MFPPPAKGGGAPLLRLAAAVAHQLCFDKAQEVLDDLGQEKAGFAYRALEQYNAELKAAGREWNDAAVREFLDERLPLAIEAAEEHALSRETVQA